MDPYSILAALSAVFKLARKCPVCRKNQVVPRDRKNETVICQYCGAKIPPVSKS